MPKLFITNGLTDPYFKKSFLIRNTLGNPVYEETALRALRAIWSTRSTLDLLGNHIDVQKAGILEG